LFLHFVRFYDDKNVKYGLHGIHANRA